MDKFKPQNMIQRLAYERHGTDSAAQFEKMLEGDPWKIARTTARYWWVNGIKKQVTINGLIALSDVLNVTIDEIVRGQVAKNETKKGKEK